MDITFLKETKEPENITVIRIVSEFFQSSRGIHCKKSLIFLKRKSLGQNIIYEDCNCSDVESVFGRIIGLNSVANGVYQVVACNFGRDYESGLIEDWDYRLIPYVENNN